MNPRPLREYEDSLCHVAHDVQRGVTLLSSDKTGRCYQIARGGGEAILMNIAGQVYQPKLIDAASFGGVMVVPAGGSARDRIQLVDAPEEGSNV